MSPLPTRMKSTTRTYSLSLSPLRCGLILGACAALGFGIGVTHGPFWIRRCKVWSSRSSAASTPIRLTPGTLASLTPTLVPLSRGGSTNTCPTPTGWTTRPSWRGEHDVNQSATRWVVVNASNVNPASNANPVYHVSIPYVTEMGTWKDVSRRTANHPPPPLSAEALVHPALVTHAHPRRVLIVSSQTDDTLCEVVKHQTVERVHVVTVNTIDRVLACGNDPRVSTTLVPSYDALWEVMMPTDRYDVVILPNVPNGRSLEPLLQVCFHALNDHGIFVQQMDSIVNRNPIDRAASRRAFTDSKQWLEQVGYKTIFEYSDSSAPKSYVLALKLFEDRGRWYRNEAEINLDLATRSIPTPNGKVPFAFDGATMMQYQFTSRLVENDWCRDNEICGDDHGHDPERMNVHISSFTVGPSAVANGGRGVFTNVDIAQDAMLAMDDLTNVIFVPSMATRWMDDMVRFDVGTLLSNFWTVVYLGYIDGYGYSSSNYGPLAFSVEPGIMSFVNHGCNGTYNTGEVYTDTECTLDVGRGPADILPSDRPAFDPRLSRYFPWSPIEVNTALHDIEAGSELLDNYLVFGGKKVLEYWDENLMELKTMCMGGSGTITMYEAATR